MKGTEFIYQTQSFLNELQKVIDTSTTDDWDENLKALTEKYNMGTQLADLEHG